MISDSGYNTSELVLPWWTGLLVGTAMTVLMLQVIALARSVPVQALVGRISVTLGLGTMQDPQAVKAWALLVGVGALFGLLHAASQVRIPTGGLLAVGIFYGVFLYVLSLLGCWLLGLTLKELVHSWSWLGGTVVFGTGLGLTAVLAERLRPGSAVLLPRD